jgi:hypothetical protein
MSSSTLQHPNHRNGFSPSRSERTRTLDSTGEFASPPTQLQLNGHASGSGSGNGYNHMNGDPQLQAQAGSSTEPQKPEKKRKKKGWKGWALVVEDDKGNILEINDGPEPDPLPSRRGRIGREVVNATANGSELPIPTPAVDTSELPRTAVAWQEMMLTYLLVEAKSPSPYIDGQTPRGSAPPVLDVAASPEKTGGCEYR